MDVQAPRPKVTLARKGSIVINSPKICIQRHSDKKEMIELRKREIIIREKLTDDKSENHHRWIQALLADLDASSACL